MTIVKQPKLLQISDDFRNIRGSFRIGGLIDVGTQASLVRLASGRYVFLDSYTLTGAVAREVDRLTDGGRDVAAILNLHPFHTVHCQRMHERYPHADLHGTARHVRRLPGLPWQEACTEDPELHAGYADDFEFSVPAGVDFISANENVHFSSVLAYHRASKTIHVDDTFMYLRMPGLLRLLGFGDATSFHLTLSKALERRPGAAEAFRAWAGDLIGRWADAENLCAAHTAALTAEHNTGASVHDRLRKALDKAGSTLAAHEQKYG